MTIDLTGGLDVSREFGFEEYPTTPGMRDAVNFWFCDEQGRFGMPRCVMEAVGPDWQNSGEASINISFPDGRVFSLREAHCKVPASNKGSDGRPTIFDAGAMRFRLLEPFRKWTASFKGQCVATTTLEQMHGTVDEKAVHSESLSFDIEMDMAVPPWVPTRHLESGLRMILTDEELVYTHEWGPCHRQEQLFRAKGRLSVGNQAYAFTGTGLRIRRQNIFKLAEFTGHVWQSALFPSGKAFGTNNYAPRRDGKPSYSEAWIFDGKELVAARVVRAPWLTQVTPSGDDVSLVLETKQGFHHIRGETFVSTFEPKGGSPMFPLFLQQANVRYRWGDEEAYGMMERSTLRHKLGI
jgi:hypothetical protein